MAQVIGVMKVLCFKVTRGVVELISIFKVIKVIIKYVRVIKHISVIKSLSL